MDSATAHAHPNGVFNALPGWARAREARPDSSQAWFLAGAALATLDPIVRSDAPFLGVWRQRLALAAAVATVERAGRAESEADLRDAWFLRKPGDALGPAGEHFSAWRMLVSTTLGSRSLTRDRLQRAAESFGLGAATPVDDLLAVLPRDENNPVRAAAEIAAAVFQQNSAAEFLGLWLADVWLARRLRWPRPLPLLAAHVSDVALRRTANARSSRPDDPGFERLVALAYAKAAASAIDFARELSRRADRLIAQQSKLRAKGAGRVIATLLADDAIAPGARMDGMSDRAMRRIVERLVGLGVARELTQRSTSRLYGL
jgi:hypothetical protein